MTTIQTAPDRFASWLESEYCASVAATMLARNEYFELLEDAMTPQKIEQLRKRQAAGSAGRKNITRLRQTQLPLEIISKGRFDKSEPTIHKGEDLDVPTYIRRGVSLN